jgi:uncharacterized membrane protein
MADRMFWLRWKQFSAFLKQSLWIFPVLSMIAAIVCGRLSRNWDASFWFAILGYGAQGARATIGVIAASMLTFVVFSFSVLLLTVQMSSAHLSPRVIARPFQSGILKAALSLFVFTFVYGVAVLGRLEEQVLEMPVFVTLALSVASIGVFLFVVEFIGKEVRPPTVMARVAKEGLDVIRSVYPKRYLTPAAEQAERGLLNRQVCRTIRHEGTPGVILAMNVKRLVAIATGHRCVIEVVPQVGDFVPAGAPLFRVYGGDAIPAGQLRPAIAFGRERTMEQDPAFAFRIIVDIAARALSPGINDPTTAVLAIDQLQYLLQEVGERDLRTGNVCDGGGQLRLVYRTADWADFVWLAIAEIREFGANSIQVTRRLLCMLENLIDLLPPVRATLLQQQIELLHVGLDRAFDDSRERRYAEIEDTQGLGGTLTRAD